MKNCICLNRKKNPKKIFLVSNIVSSACLLSMAIELAIKIISALKPSLSGFSGENKFSWKQVESQVCVNEILDMKLNCRSSSSVPPHRTIISLCVHSLNRCSYLIYSFSCVFFLPLSLTINSHFTLTITI